MFSCQDRGLENISSAKQDEIDRIFKRISHIKAQPSLNLSSEPSHGSYDSWYWSDRALMESCVVGQSRNQVIEPDLLLSFF